MNNQQAKKIIRETFESPFDKVRFSGFVKNLLNHIEDAPFPRPYQGSYIPEAYRQYVKSLERVGKYSDGENALDILIITLQKDTSLERARTMQRNFIAWYLNGSRGGIMKDAALAAYVSPNHDDWRFSLVRMDYKFEKTDTDRMKVKEKFTPARRWSFLVGSNEKSHTAQSRLVKILADDEHDPTLEELEEVFNIETVTKEFFLKYRELFIRTREALEKIVTEYPNVKADFDAKGVDTVNFAKKLLGQIVFLYFLQKKGWFGVGRDDDWGSGSKQFLRELFTGTHGRYQNFFNDILEPLFYEALRIDRSHDDDYYSRFNCKIPFLNGGLFDPIGNYDWVHTDIHIPNEIFSNTRKTKEGDSGDGILDVFDRYNFTVREDEPLEKEVAIDPELLGKAYEKFNAIRPDNFDEFIKALKSGKKGEESKFNKKFGVYYTPREIVHYMCKQSLINYLATRAEDAKLDIPISKQDIEDLIEVGELITEHEATALIKEKSIKDGTLKSTEYTSLLSEGIRKNANLIDDWLEDITVCDPAVGSGAFPVGMMAEIVRVRSVLSVFLQENGRSDYVFKRRCIEHSLYGVDIDPGAVEIAKLRLWLSLVVDEEDIKNIKPLPNLDYKIVCGNSLLGYPYTPMGLKDIEKLKEQYFYETRPSEKIRLRQQIDKAIYNLFDDTEKTLGYKVSMDFKINFSEVFREKGGFDVVIANPPYVRVDDLDKLIKIIYKTNFKTAVGKYDLYYLFFEKSLNLSNHNGLCVFISPNRFCASDSASRLREIIINTIKSGEIISTSQIKVFEASNYPIISVLNKAKTGETFFIRQIDNLSQLVKSIEFLEKKYYAYRSHFELLPNKVIPININQSAFNLVRRLYAEKQIMAKYLCVSEGLRIPSKLETESINDLKIVKQYQFIRYSTIKDGSFISSKKLSEIISSKSNRYNKIFSEKILIAEDALQITATLDKDKCVPQGGVYFATPASKKLPIKFFLGLLNSKFLSYIYEALYAGMHMGGGYMRYRSKFLENLPIPEKIENVYAEKINTIVDQILSITKSDDYLQNPQKQARVEELEREIDQLVYKLYDLTDEEIRIVEGEK